MFCVSLPCNRVEKEGGMSREWQGRGTGMPGSTLEKVRGREPRQGQLSGVGGRKGVGHPAGIPYLFPLCPE